MPLKDRCHIATWHRSLNGEHLCFFFLFFLGLCPGSKGTGCLFGMCLFKQEKLKLCVFCLFPMYNPNCFVCVLFSNYVHIIQIEYFRCIVVFDCNVLVLAGSFGRDKSQNYIQSTLFLFII